ncbi:M23 family metallopeptidase [Bacillus sp. AK128]
MQKWIILFLILSIVVTGCGKQQEVKEVDKDKESKEEAEKPNTPVYTVQLTEENNQMFLSLDELSQKMDLTYQYDNLNRLVKFYINNLEYKLIYGVPVYERNSEYVPTERGHLMVINNEPFLSINFVLDELGWNVKENGQVASISISENKGDIPVSATPTKPTNVDEILSILSILENPISGAKVSTIVSHLPGAPRNYRNGTHEGLDFYQYGTNVEINPNTPVYAMGEGKVVRVDHDYPGYSSVEERNDDLSIAANSEITPAYILDKLRGKQVWVTYPNGILARFAHLDRVADDLSVGDIVTKDRIIGYVGNSGTSGEVLKNNTEYHLHLDLLIHNELFWVGLDDQEVITILTSVFEK